MRVSHDFLEINVFRCFLKAELYCDDSMWMSSSFHHQEHTIGIDLLTKGNGDKVLMSELMEVGAVLLMVLKTSTKPLNIM